MATFPDAPFGLVLIYKDSLYMTDTALFLHRFPSSGLSRLRNHLVFDPALSFFFFLLLCSLPRRH